MSERIGRVDFLASLDGRNLPAEARRLGREIGEAGGDEAGKSFNNRFEGTAGGGLTRVARDFADRLGASGKLGGERFGDTFSSEVQNKFRRMQSDVARILGDKSAFADWAKGFGDSSEDVDKAVGSLVADLERLRKEQVLTADENGKLAKSSMFTSGEFNKFKAVAKDLGEELKVTRTEQAGAAEAAEQHRAKQEKLNAEMNRFLRLVGDGGAFRQLADRMGDTNQAYDHMQAELNDLYEKQRINIDQLYRYSDALERTKDKTEASLAVERRKTSQLAELAEKTNEVADGSHRAGSAFERLNKRMLNSHGFKQAAFWTGLVASSAEHIAVLGSAAGAGMIALGGALVQFGIGAGAAVAVFTRLNKDLDELPESLRQVAGQFQGFKRELSGLADTISEGAFAEMDGTFDRLSETVRGLSPAFNSLGTTIGRVFDDFSRAVAPGTEMFGQLETLVRNSATGFESLMRSAGTLGGALVRSFNEGQPLIEMFYGWIDKLATRFDSFTRSSGFDEWIGNAQRVFGSLGPLLDATGRALNDLVTPETVQRTVDFLDNLAAFMPDLSRLLNMIGGLDAFGLAAQLLADFGKALRPLAEPMTKLAVQINRVASSLIESLAEALGSIARLIAPVVEGFADFVAAIPDGQLDLLAASVASLAGAFVLLKGASGILGAVDALGLFGGAAGRAQGAASSMIGTLGGFAGKAGLIGGVTVAAFAAADAFGEWLNKVQGWDAKAEQLVQSNASLSESFKTLRPMDNFNWETDLQGLVELQNGFLGLEWPMTAAQFAGEAIGAGLEELDKTMRNMPLTQIQSQFQAWAKETGATDAQLLAMLGSMDGVSGALKAAAIDAGHLGTEQDVLSLAMGEGKVSADAAKGALDGVAVQAETTQDRISKLSAQIETFGGKELDARAATRQFEQATADLTAKLADNGATLDLSTEAGRQNSAAIDNLIKATNDHAAATLENTDDQEAANAVIADGKTRLQALFDQFGITGAEADRYTGTLKEIPDDIDTFIGNSSPEAQAKVQAYKDHLMSIPPSEWTEIQSNAWDQIVVLEGVKAALQALDGFTAYTSVHTEYTVSGTGGGGPNAEMQASGGMFNGARQVTMGEAGPEAIVPLRRPLSQVDPSVRALSAFAQGLGVPNMASGGVVGGGRQVVVEPGAIVVQDSGDKYGAARAVLDAMARELA